MEKIEMTVEVGRNSGKGVARSLRREGKVPGVLYGRSPAVALSIEKKPLLKLLNGGGGAEHSLLNLNLAGATENATRWAVIKDYQVDPVRNELLHVDFIEVDLEKKIKVQVKIVPEGTPAGVKMGGILQRLLRAVEVECLPTDMPGTITVDVSALEMGQSLHVSDLPIPEDAVILTPITETVLLVAEPRKAAVEAEEAEAEEVAEAGEEPAAAEGEAKPEGEEKAGEKEES